VPSIAAVVATKNWPDVFHYSTQVRTQPTKTEMIEGFFEPGGGMVKECLKAYYLTCRNTKMRKPSQIIVYSKKQKAQGLGIEAGDERLGWQPSNASPERGRGGERGEGGWSSGSSPGRCIGVTVKKTVTS